MFCLPKTAWPPTWEAFGEAQAAFLSRPAVTKDRTDSGDVFSMLMIRMARFGAKKKPTYRVVVIDKERARNSRSVEVVGFYNPVAKPAQVQLNRERIEHWIKAGAQPSDTVARLLKASPVEPPPAAV